MQSRKRIVIAGAAGRDFHDFNTVFRDHKRFQVVAFTATQIPNIEGRRYPPALAGSLYPKGIPIHPEDELESLIKGQNVDQVIFSYSDVSHEHVMHLASRVLAAGADFRLLGPRQTMLNSRLSVVSVGAVRTGCGKSQTSRYVVKALQRMGFGRVVAVRHPMPYGALEKQVSQRYASYADLDRNECTIEEREEFEPYLALGAVVYAGVDYQVVLKNAEAEADVIVWDGGNNDLPFFRSTFHVVVTDPHRPGHEVKYHPGETNLRMADAVVINKVDTADLESVLMVQRNTRRVNDRAAIVKAASPIIVEDPSLIRGKRVLVVEDGPTLTHGEMSFGAGVVAARAYEAAEVVDPRPFAVGSIARTYDKYPDTGPVLPAMGYGAEQIGDLQATINATPADLVLVATPINLGRLIDIRQPCQRVSYELQIIGQPTLAELLASSLGR